MNISIMEAELAKLFVGANASVILSTSYQHDLSSHGLDALFAGEDLILTLVYFYGESLLLELSYTSPLSNQQSCQTKRSLLDTLTKY